MTWCQSQYVSLPFVIRNFGWFCLQYEDYVAFCSKITWTHCILQEQVIFEHVFWDVENFSVPNQCYQSMQRKITFPMMYFTHFWFSSDLTPLKKKLSKFISNNTSEVIFNQEWKSRETETRKMQQSICAKVKTIWNEEWVKLEFGKTGLIKPFE